MSEEAVKWMDKVSGEDKPFFMNYWMFSVHGPWNAKEELIEKYKDPSNRRRLFLRLTAKGHDLLQQIEEAAYGDNQAHDLAA